MSNLGSATLAEATAVMVLQFHKVRLRNQTAGQNLVLPVNIQRMNRIGTFVWMFTTQRSVQVLIHTPGWMFLDCRYLQIIGVPAKNHLQVVLVMCHGPTSDMPSSLQSLSKVERKQLLNSRNTENLSKLEVDYPLMSP